jgi:hypothetical protein
MTVYYLLRSAWLDSCRLRKAALSPLMRCYEADSQLFVDALYILHC